MRTYKVIYSQSEDLYIFVPGKEGDLDLASARAEVDRLNQKLRWSAKQSSMNTYVWLLLPSTPGEKSEVIAIFDTGIDGHLDAEGNAKLAACAPNLLAALKACELQLREYVDWHHKYSGGCSIEIESAWERAKDAIAQAEQAKGGKHP